MLLDIYTKIIIVNNNPINMERYTTQKCYVCHTLFENSQLNEKFIVFPHPYVGLTVICYVCANPHKPRLCKFFNPQKCHKCSIILRSNKKNKDWYIVPNPYIGKTVYCYNCVNPNKYKKIKSPQRDAAKSGETSNETAEHTKKQSPLKKSQNLSEKEPSGKDLMRESTGSENISDDMYQSLLSENTENRNSETPSRKNSPVLTKKISNPMFLTKIPSEKTLPVSLMTHPEDKRESLKSEPKITPLEQKITLHEFFMSLPEKPDEKKDKKTSSGTGTLRRSISTTLGLKPTRSDDRYNLSSEKDKLVSAPSSPETERKLKRQRSNSCNSFEQLQRDWLKNTKTNKKNEKKKENKKNNKTENVEGKKKRTGSFLAKLGIKT